MGIRVGFYLGSEDGMLGHFLGAPLAAFHDWYISVSEEFPNDFNPDAIELLKSVLDKGSAVLEHPANAKATDALLTDFYLTFVSDQKEDSAYPFEYAHESWVNIRFYRDAITAREERLPLSVIRLLEYIFTGRPILRSRDHQPFYSEDGGVRLAFWTYKEVATIARELLGAEFTEEEALFRNISGAVNHALQKQTGIIILVA
ncbi:hypothetical protein [Deinococcus puniceus]|uniref:Uncharacterized protein n=1 Tax=Deinococcus puniceus TaxID=1182568 RepID=A0A172T979_9DEIO|nr:hypothetical protein [Deinococcus puniceus]ANE43512.1 hypothetical protein SU48_06725 [Deinococcus puniceus]